MTFRAPPPEFFYATESHPWRALYRSRFARLCAAVFLAVAAATMAGRGM
jgi:hypothetical protein